MAVRNEHISAGPVTEALEAEIARALDVPYAVVTTSGSAALFLALQAVGVRRGDEVIVPDRTWIATAHAVLLAGAKVVLADVRSDIPTLDVERLKEKITPRTKAILPVHLNGRAVEMDKVHALAAEHGLRVVEDACQALFSRDSGCCLGTQSDAGCFSMSVTKLISTGQGGFAVTKDKAVYEQMTALRNHGVADYFADRWNQFGFNLKFTDLLASFGLVQLAKAAERVAVLQAIYEKYRNGLVGLRSVKLLPSRVAAGELPLYAEVLCTERERLVEFLAARDIQTRPVPPNLDISDYIENDGNYPNSRRFAEQGMYLPCGPGQPLENIDRVIEAVAQFAPREV